MTIEPGDVVDGFVVGPRLHAGGAAVLFAASHPDHDRPLLLKVPRLGPDQPTAGIVAFETEAMIMPALSGPHVPYFVGAGPLSGRPYIAMERVEGVTVSERVRDGGLPDWGEVAALGAALARALDSLHRQDVVHLDVKPANLILRPDGSIVVIDFGFAHHAHFPDLFQEESRKAVGSPPYIAPEQVLGVRADARSDVYAAGVTLYELATGELPFGIPATERELRARLWVEPPPPRSLRPDCPPWIQEVLLTCLEPEPGSRYASAALLARAFAEPASVVLSDRAARTDRPGFFRQLYRGLTYRRAAETPRASPSEQVEAVPLIMVALDLASDDARIGRAIGEATRRALARHPQSRLSCVTVLAPGHIVERRGNSESERHHAALVALQAWVNAHRLPQARCTLHVFETDDPAGRILRFADDNHVDAIVIGAAHRPHHILGRSVMTRIAEEAQASVHIVRAVGHALAAETPK